MQDLEVKAADVVASTKLVLARATISKQCQSGCSMNDIVKTFNENLEALGNSFPDHDLRFANMCIQFEHVAIETFRSQAQGKQANQQTMVQMARDLAQLASAKRQDGQSYHAKLYARQMLKNFLATTELTGIGQSHQASAQYQRILEILSAPIKSTDAATLP